MGLEGNAMKSFIAACIALVVIAVGAAMVLDRFQKPAEQAYATTGARVQAH
jgi:hypothetical protein